MTHGVSVSVLNDVFRLFRRFTTPPSACPFADFTVRSQFDDEVHF